MKKCSYCGSHNGPRGNSCSKCGGPWVPQEDATVGIAERGWPFYIGGYWIWPEYGFLNDIRRFDVYAGDRWLAAIEITREAWRQNVAEGEDGTPFMLSLIRAALGETIEFPMARGECASMVCHRSDVAYAPDDTLAGEDS